MADARIISLASPGQDGSAPSSPILSPAEPEEAEEAFVLVDAPITSLASLTSKVTIAKKASQTWKGFSLKKQLNRVKKNTLAVKEKSSACPSPGNVSPSDDAPADPGGFEEEVRTEGGGASEKWPDGRTPGDDVVGDDGGVEEGDARLSRPVDLPLFDNDQPVRPARYQKKKTSADSGSKRDVRLLSVPNVKAQKTEQGTCRDLRRKAQPAGHAGQASIGNILIRRFSKLRALSKAVHGPGRLHVLLSIPFSPSPVQAST